MRAGRDHEAEAILRASIDCARQQQARSWELRSSTTLATLCVSRGQRDEARNLLSLQSTSGLPKARKRQIWSRHGVTAKPGASYIR